MVTTKSQMIVLIVPTCIITVLVMLTHDGIILLTFSPSADVLSWYPHDGDPCPMYRNRECCVKQIRVDISAFTSDLYPEPLFDNNVFKNPIFAGDDIDTPNYDLPTKVNLLNVGTMDN